MSHTNLRFYVFRRKKNPTVQNKNVLLNTVFVGLSLTHRHQEHHHQRAGIVVGMSLGKQQARKCKHLPKFVARAFFLSTLTLVCFEWVSDALEIIIFFSRLVRKDFKL